MSRYKMYSLIKDLPEISVNVIMIFETSDGLAKNENIKKSATMTLKTAP